MVTLDPNRDVESLTKGFFSTLVISLPLGHSTVVLVSFLIKDCSDLPTSPLVLVKAPCDIF